MPSGGDGFYYFSAYFIVRQFEHAGFAIEINGEFICIAWADRDNSIYADPGPTSCSGATFAAAGKIMNSLLVDYIHTIFFPLNDFTF